MNRLTGETVRAAFAGRTDAGVHAMGQVAAFDTQARLDVGEFVRGLNHFLSATSPCWRAARRRSALRPAARRAGQAVPLPHRGAARCARRSGGTGRGWSDSRSTLRRCSARHGRLEGAHDFAAFAPPFDGRTERTLRRCEVAAAGCPHGQTVQVEMEARGVPAAPGAQDGWPARRSGQRPDERRWSRRACSTMRSRRAQARRRPACGLYLVSVAYDGLDFGAEEGNGRDG